MNPETHRPMQVGIAAIFRNEGPYIVEWIAHHRLLGIDHFFIADNESTDGSSEVLQALHRLGYIQCIRFPSPPGQAPQMLAYARMFADYSDQVDWLAFIDADELIWPTGGQSTFIEWLAQLAKQPDIGAILLNWSVYGSAWLANHSAGLVIDRFNRRAAQQFGPNHHYKTILRTVALASQSSNPHHFELKTGWRHVHADGTELALHPTHGTGLSQQVIWGPYRLNHYIVKSHQEFFERKATNGSAASLSRVKGEDYFRRHDRNDVRDAAPPRWSELVAQETQRINAQLSAQSCEIASDPTEAARYSPPFQTTYGNVEVIEHKDDELHLRGWAVSRNGRAVANLLIEIDGVPIQTQSHTVRNRPDVQRHYPGAALNTGFHIVARVADLNPQEARILLYARSPDVSDQIAMVMPPPQNKSAGSKLNYKENNEALSKRG